MNKGTAIAIISISTIVVAGGYWLFVLRKKNGVSKEDAAELSNYVPSDKPIADAATQSASNIFKDSFKNVFPQRAYT